MTKNKADKAMRMVIVYPLILCGIGIYIPKRTFQKQVPISIFKVALEIE